MADVMRDPRVLLAACLLHPLPVALATAIKEVLATAPQQQAKPCDMGQMCLNCQPKGPNGECPDKQAEPVQFDESIPSLAQRLRAKGYPAEGAGSAIENIKDGGND